MSVYRFMDSRTTQADRMAALGVEFVGWSSWKLGSHLVLYRRCYRTRKYEWRYYIDYDANDYLAFATFDELETYLSVLVEVA